MTTPSEEQGSGMPDAPDEAASGQPAGDGAEVVRADETPAGGMKLSGVEAAGADGLAPSSAGGHSNGEALAAEGAAVPGTTPAAQTWRPLSGVRRSGNRPSGSQPNWPQLLEGTGTERRLTSQQNSHS